MKKFWTKRAQLNSILLFILLAEAVVAIWWMSTHKSMYFPNSPSAPASTSGGSENKTAKEPVFTLGSMRFSYPSTLLLSQEGEKATLSHSTAYEHSNYCDFKGDEPKLKEIADFGMSFELIHSSLKPAMGAHEPEFFMEHQFQGPTPTISEGFVDAYEIGSFKGYQIINAVEGCGSYDYFFPLANNTTLYINRIFPDGILSVEEGKTQVLPGVIMPKTQEEIFKQILTSAVFL